MADLTAAQAGEIDLLIEEHGEGRVTAGKNKAVVFQTKDRAWTIDAAGVVSLVPGLEIDLPETGASESLGGPDQAAGNGESKTPDPETSDGPNKGGNPSEDEQATSGSNSPSGESGALVPIAASERGNDRTQVLGPDPSELSAADRTDAYRAMSKADERQVAMELEGNAPKAAVYSFKQGGSQVVGLSWKGVREVVRTFNARGMGEIQVDGSRPPVYEDVMVRAEIGQGPEGKIYGDVPGIRVTVYATDKQHGGGNWGTATATRDQVNKKRKNAEGIYEWQPDTFAATKALSKAQRNALEPLIPLELVEELKSLYVGRGQVEYIPASGRDTTPELPPALTDEKALAQMDKCRELYQEWKKVGGQKKMPPALFNRSMQAAQHSHERLDDFIAHLQSELEAAQDA